VFVKIIALLASHITQTVGNLHAALELMHLHLLNYDLRLISAKLDVVLTSHNSCNLTGISDNMRQEVFATLGPILESQPS
jgi:hypothetical protein